MFHSTTKSFRLRATMFLATIGLATAMGDFAVRPSHADSSLDAAQDIRVSHKAHIAAALDERTELDFADQPLSDVVDYLKQRHEIEIQLDNKALTEAGVGSDTPISRAIKGITLESALDLMLTPLDLTWVIHDEVLFITSKTHAQKMIETRIYPVRDLVAPLAGELPPIDGPDYDSLVEVLAEVAGTDDGAPDSRLIRVYRPAAALVVTRPVVVHQRIEKLLKELRRAKAEHSTW